MLNFEFNNNRLDDNPLDQINNLPNQQLFNYLHNHFEKIYEISSMDDLIERGNRRANIIMKKTSYWIFAHSFH